MKYSHKVADVYISSVELTVELEYDEVSVQTTDGKRVSLPSRDPVAMKLMETFQPKPADPPWWKHLFAVLLTLSLMIAFFAGSITLLTRVGFSLPVSAIMTIGYFVVSVFIVFNERKPNAS